MNKKNLLLWLLLTTTFSSVFSQEETDTLELGLEENLQTTAAIAEAAPPESDTLTRSEIIDALRKGIVVNLDRKGKSWMKFLVFSQLAARYNGEDRVNGTEPASNSSTVLNYNRQEKKLELGLDRARFITAANFFDKIFLFSQFGTAGLTGINNDNLNTLAQEQETQLSLLTFYSELNFSKAINIGAGLHNYKGVSRVNNSGLVDLIPQDLSLALIPGFSHYDQFTYALGVFVKGIAGKFRYQFAIDEATRNNISRDLYLNVNNSLSENGLPDDIKDGLNPLAPNKNHAVYRGAEILGGKKAGTTYSGYVTLHVFDEESDRISFRTGSYFGTKKVLNLGAGFFHHPNGSVILDANNNLRGQDVNVFGADIFYDAPINGKKDALTVYGLFQTMDYGKNFNLSQYNSTAYPLTATTLNSDASLPFANGNLQYLQLAYFNRELKLQPYAYFQNRNLETTEDTETTFGIGTNYHLLGPNVRLTAEYRNRKLADFDSDDQFTLQLVFFM